MDEDNTGRIRLIRVSQTALVRRVGGATRTTRPQVTDNTFDVASTFQAQPSGSCSRLSHTSQAYMMQ